MLAVLLAVALGALAAVAGTASATGMHGRATVYTQTNDPAGNRIQVFHRAPGGAIAPGRSHPTGGLGTGGGLGNQGAVTLAGRWLLAVNAGSDEVSLFRVHRRGLALTDVVPSGGDQPVSVASDGRRAWVLNAGDPGGVAAFAIGRDGRLTRLPGALAPLSAPAAGAAQVALAPDGASLAVTEKATNVIDTYPLAPDGTVGAPAVSPSAGETPFGFAFDPRGRMIVSEAFGGRDGESAVSSYALRAGGGVVPITAVARTGQTAACWVAVTADGRFAYTTNTGSDSITGYRIGKGGAITRLSSVTARTGDGPTDMAFDRRGVLYALDAAAGTLGAYRAGGDGRLTPVGRAGGLPAGAVTGLAAR
jgi:6-phosphogluconolactonase (cycloisomerase 2 family)